MVHSLVRSVLFQNLIGLILFASPLAQASPGSISFQSRIVKPDSTALEASSVQFRFNITDSLGTCVIYQEDFNNINMSGSKGLVTLTLGTGSRVFPAGIFTLNEAFNNYASPSMNCQAGGNVTMGTSDKRRMIMQFNDGSGWQTVPAMEINSTPFALQSVTAQKLGSYPANEYLRTAQLPTCGGADVLTFNGTSIVCVAGGGGGGGTVTNVTSANSDISVATGTTTPVLTLNTGTGANQIVKLDGSGALPALSGANVTNLSATNLASGTGCRRRKCRRLLVM